jgi:diguanylate cyclase (GGDEF)-like protein
MSMRPNFIRRRRATDGPVRPSNLRPNAYIAIVIAAGAVLTVLATSRYGLLPEHNALTVLLFAGGVVIGELFPLRVHRPGAEGEVTPSTTFAFALVLVAGYAAVPLMAASCLICDRITGKSPVKILFNAGQYAITVFATATALALIAGVPSPGDGVPFTAADLPGVLLAGVVFFAANSLLVASVIALLEHQPVTRCLSDDLLFQATSAGLLLGLAPMVVISALFSPLLLPLFVLPLLSIVQGQRQALLKEHEAIHDALTGLPNRVLFGDRVNTAIRVSEQDRAQAAVMVIDLDGFKEINDTLGHHEGDRLLVTLAMRLRSSLREDDVVARLGGDEFGVLLSGVNRAQATLVARKLDAALREPLELDDIEIEMGGSIGVAMYPEHGTQVDSLIQHADVAMYRAKQEDRGMDFYDPEEGAEISRTVIAADLRRGLEAGELIPFFQPKVELATGRVVGVEALMRWRHPTRGLLLPADFISLAEQSGEIVRATDRILESALRAAESWTPGEPRLTVAVNLSARSLLDRRLADRIAGVLERTGAPPGALELEITESMLMADPERATQLLRRVREMGVSVAIDDFGTGYSSLERLRRLPIDAVKIDKSFVLGMSTDHSDRVIVQSTIQLARHLGLTVVAEGAEDAAIWDTLAGMGCDCAQGFYAAHPMPSDDFARWLARRPAPVPFLATTAIAV